MWEADPAQSFDSRVFPSACIRARATTISELQNSKESPNTSNCGSPNIFWSCEVLRNCGTHKHIGMAASHGTAQFQKILFHTMDFGPGGSHGAVGQEWGNQSSRGRAGLEGDGWGGMHTATRPRANKNLNASPQHLARPLSTCGAYHPPPKWAPDRLCVTYTTVLLTGESWWPL